jgi:hypothetical protein
VFSTRCGFWCVLNHPVCLRMFSFFCVWVGSALLFLPSGRSGFDFRQEQEIYLLYGAQAGSEALPASYQMGTRG